MSLASYSRNSSDGVYSTTSLHEQCTVAQKATLRHTALLSRAMQLI